MKNATVVMLLDNPFFSDARVEKEATSLLKEGFTVIVYCVSDDNLPAEENRNGIVIKRILNLFFQKPFGKTYSEQLTLFSNEILKESFIILHCHDFMLVALGAEIKRKKINVFFTYDSHEYLIGWPYYQEIPSPINRFKGYLVWKKLLWNEKKAVQSTNALLTPSSAIAKALKQQFKLRFSGIPIRNIPELKAPNTGISLRSSLKISDDRKLIVHSGSIYMPSKFIEQLVSFVNTSNDLSLVFIGNRVIHTNLTEKYKAIHHIYFIDYHPNILLDQLASCDAGIIYTRSKTYKAHKLGSSNKLMEYGLAGLPTIGTYQLAHEELNDQFQHIELFSENDFESFKTAINRMIETLLQKKKNAERIKYSLSWETEFAPVVELYKRVAARLAD
jgi:glycosyltransferase involved in cell wall biosynthesis